MGSVFHSLPLLRQAAPQLSKHFFTCHLPRAARLRVQVPRKEIPKAGFWRTFRTGGSRNATLTTESTRSQSPLSSLGKSLGSPQTAKVTARTFPETSEKIVAYWLLGSAASVFGLVVFGGLTRLTESG